MGIQPNPVNSFLIKIQDWCEVIRSLQKMGLPLYLVTCLVIVKLISAQSTSHTHNTCVGDSCEIWRTPVPNMGAALVGYNPMVGNRFSGTDPGFRNAIFEPTEVSDDGQLSAHPSINWKDDINCNINSGTRVIRNYRQYREEKSGSLSFSEQSQKAFSLNVPFISLLTNFEHKLSGKQSTRKSRQYKNEVDFFKETKGEIYINEARCEVYKISVDAFHEPKFTPGFVSAMRALHKSAANPTSRRSKRTLKKFIANFGTHFMSEAWLGATLITETRIAESSTSAAQRQERRNCINRAFSVGTNTGVSHREVDVSYKVQGPEVSVNVPVPVPVGGVPVPVPGPVTGTVKGPEVGAATTVGGWGAGSGAKYRREASRCGGNHTDSFFSARRNFQRSTIKSVGSLPLADTDEWARNTKESPSVIRFNLQSISNLIYDFAGDVTVDDDNPNAGNLDADRMYTYLEQATNNYCETVLGEPCPAVKGCAYENLCPPNKICVDDDSAALGFVCHAPVAPVNGGWSSWDRCTRTCGMGIRRRTCTDPAPADGGSGCYGSSEEYCNTQACEPKPKSCGWFDSMCSVHSPYPL